MLLTTSADSLSRAVYNALLFTTKKDPWASALLQTTSEGVSYLTSDSYALLWSSCAGEWSGDHSEVTMKITREDLVILEERTRKDKKAEVRLILTPGETVEYKGDTQAPDVFKDVYTDSPLDDSWDDISLQMFQWVIREREEDDRMPPLSLGVMLDRKYLTKLGQIKVPDKDTGADFWFGPDEDDPVLIKVGPDTLVYIEPIIRERHAEALGGDVTW